jgi:hypothetical protein
MRQTFESVALLVQDNFNDVEEKDYEYLECHDDVSTDELKLHEEPGHIKTQVEDETDLPNDNMCKTLKQKLKV